MDKKVIFLVIVFSVFNFACDKDKSNTQNNDFFPPVNFDISINLVLPDAAPLQNVGGFIYRDGQGVGYKGIIIYNNFEELIAFDRACPYKVDSSCSRIFMSDNISKYQCGSSTNRCCESEFFLSTGTPSKGPADKPLRQYFVTRNGNFIRVTSFPQ
jgi:nitrite reductase/ring-hydroxylating ferredoxin subunit